MVGEPSTGARAYAPGRFAATGREGARLRRRVLAIALTVLLAAALAIRLESAAGPGPIWFAPNSFWNRPLPSDPQLDPNSASMVTALAGAASNAHISNDRSWGIPVVTATIGDPTYRLTSLDYAAGPQPVTCRVPRGVQANRGSDAHLAVLQPDGTECDFWRFSRTANGTPQAGSVGKVCGTVWGTNTTAWGTLPCRGAAGNGVAASGFALTGGIIRPQEISASGSISHAVELSLPSSIVRSGIVWPASHSDGNCASTTGCIPEGALIRLDPTFNVAAQSWPAWEKTIAEAMQTYGAYVADQGGSLELRAREQSGETTWTRVRVPIDASLTSLPWASMQVLDITPGPGPPPSWWTGG